MKQCPKCKCKTFIANAHVVQSWIVDSDGDYLSTNEDCVTVAHYPDNEDIWTCAECGYNGAGEKFEVD